ncbi:MAG TPA: extracellular solute-binding protein [Tepidisphaeraceae bacterium]|jgi:multiple sugar transport system substrate-binding protein|nr:extracellular solute-binding protein [Tepidisphaeraceae bacterium]
MSSFSTRILSGIKRLVVVALIASGLGLLAFGPRAGEELPKDCVIVDYWEKWTGDEEAGMHQIVDDFNTTVGRKEHIYVRYLSTSSIEQKTLVAIAAGTPPDVAGLYNQDIPQYGALDSLQPLDDLAAEHGITAQMYKKVFWDECHYDGHLYGLVSSAYDVALYYNTHIFRQSASALEARGLDPQRAPRTIAELDQYAQALDRFDPSGRITLAGYLPMEPGWYLNYTCIWFGGSWWNNAEHKFTFTDPGVVNSFKWIQSYSDRLGPTAVNDFRSGFGTIDSPQNAFLTPSVAMVQQGTFFAHFIHRQNPSMDGHWAAAPFPSALPNLRDVTYCNCDVLVIPRGARHQKEAFEFIAFVNRQDEMEKLANLHCKISPLAKVSEGFLAHSNNPYIRVFDRLAASPNAHPTEPIPILPEVNDELNDFEQQLQLQQVSPEEGLRQVQVRLQQKYDQFMEDQRQRRKQHGQTAF